MQTIRTPDHELIRRISLEDKEAYNMLFDRYWKHLFTVVYRMINDEEQTKDIVQEVFLYIWNKRQSLYTHQSFEPYLLSAAKNAVFTSYRKNKIRLIGEIELLRTISTPEESDEKLIGKEMINMVDHELRQMPSNMHRCFKLSRSEGKTIRAISRELNLSEQTVKNNISEATRRLRKALNRQLVPGIAILLAAHAITGNLIKA